MKRWLLDYAGLGKPRRFERTLAVLLSLILATVAGGIFLHLHYMEEEVTEGTPRWWYFVYLGVLIASGFLLARWPRLAAVALSVAVLEVGFGIGTAALYKFRLTDAALFPRDFGFDSRFSWHPLLQAVPIPTGISPKLRVVHNSQRQRGPERRAEFLRDKAVIALFGGSTTYDIVVRDDETWPHHLEAILGADRFAVLNHGVPGYTTAENVIQTAFYEDTYGVTPRCSLYLLGWNDLRNSHIRGLDPGYADFHLPSQIDALQARWVSGPYLSVSPTLSFAARLAVLAFDTARPPPRPAGAVSPEPDPAFEALYIRNIHTISAINRQRGIRTLWIGQVMDRERLVGGEPYGWMPFLRVRDVWPLIERLNGIVKREAEALGDVYVDIPSDRFITDDFADHGHFLPEGSLKFATLLAPMVADECR